MMTTAAPMKKKVSYYYDAEIGNFYYAQGHPMKPHRVRMTHELVVAYEMFNKMEVLSPPRAPERELTRFHADEYVNFLKTVTPETAQENAMTLQRFNVVEDCPVFDGLWDFCQIAGGGSLAGASRLNSGSADIAINWAGGLHHAKKAEASGFCYVNDCVLGILELLKVHARVLYVDIDIHHGDGVEEAFYTTDRVMTVSFHKFGDYFPGTGDVGDFGNGPGLHYSVNFPLKDGINDECYREVFEPIMTKVMEWYSPGAVVLQCGADSLSGDRLGSFNLSLRGHAQCVDFFRRYDVPLLLLGGGGYTIRNVARCWAFETSRAINMELSDDMPYNKYFEFYGPEFRLHLTPSNMENVNSREYLETVKAKVMESLRHLPSAPSVQMHDAPPPVDVTDPSLSKDMQVHAKPRSQDPYFDSDAEDDDDEDYSHALKNAKNRTKMTRASEPPETTAPSGVSATVAMNGGHVRGAPQQAQSRDVPTPMEIDAKATPRTEVNASASKPPVGAPTPPQQAPAPEEPRQASTAAASERGKLTDEVPMEVDEAPASTVRTRPPSKPADEGATPADGEAVDQKPPKKARHSPDATGRDAPQVAAAPAKPEAVDSGADGGDGGRGSVGADEPAKVGGPKRAAEAASPDDAPLEAPAPAPAPQPAATAEVSSTVDSARAAASRAPAAPETPDVTTEGSAVPEDQPSERAESAPVAPSSGTGGADGRPEDTRREDGPRTDTTPQEGTSPQPRAPQKDATEAREPSAAPASDERRVPSAEPGSDEVHQGPSTSDEAGKDGPEVVTEAASAGMEDEPPRKAEAAPAEDEPPGGAASTAAEDEPAGTAAPAPAEDEPAGKVAPAAAGNEPAGEAPPAREPDAPSAPAQDAGSATPEAEPAEAPAKDGATAADEPEAPPPSAAPAEAAQGAATAKGTSATERRESAEEEAGAVGAPEGDSQAAERRGAAEPPPPAGGDADAAKAADSGADAGAAPDKSSESTVPGGGEHRDPADDHAASAEPAADGRPDDREEGTAGGGERAGHDEDRVQSSDTGRTAVVGAEHTEPGDREVREHKQPEPGTKPPEAAAEPAAAPPTASEPPTDGDKADGDKADGGSEKASVEALAKDTSGDPEAADGAQARPEPAGEADKAGHEPMDVEPAAPAAPARDAADEDSKAPDPKTAEGAASES